MDTTPAKIWVTVEKAQTNPPDGHIVAPQGKQTVAIGDTVKFKASASADNSSSLTYVWDFGAYAPRKMGQSISMKFDRAGEVKVRLLVSDSHGLFDKTPASVMLSVIEKVEQNNSPPDTAIVLPASDMTINVGDAIAFSGIAVDPENDPRITYRWNFDGAVPNSIGPEAGEILFATPGVFRVTLTAIDSANNADPTPAVRIITVVDTNVTVVPLKKPLDPATQPQFVNQLPIIRALEPKVENGFETYTMEMTEFSQDLGLKDPVTGKALMTTVWGVDGSYPGPTIHARSTLSAGNNVSGKPVKVHWVNELPDRHLLPIDPTVRCGENAPSCQPEVRTVVHLHGGHTDADSDGHPDAWFTRENKVVGPKFKASMGGVYTYRNDQEAASLWYHDHAMGITRLNVYAGLAGFYLLHDANEDRLKAQGYLPDEQYDIPLLIQDKSFNQDGSLRYTRGEPVSFDPLTGEPDPSVVPEFYGDTILVNGKVWPKLEVEPRVYRFRILNGSNSRFYNFRLTAGFQDIPFYIIGTDGGLLDHSVRRVSTLLAPAERVEILVDFSDPRLAGQYIIVTNDANSPYPDGDPVTPGLTDRVMAFHVSLPLDISKRQTLIPGSLRMQAIPTLSPTPGISERELLLSEGTDTYGRILPQLGTSAGGAMYWADPITETPLLGTTEVWSIINNTGDTHPIHQHLVQFRIVERQAFDVNSYVPGDPASLRLLGPVKKPAPEEAGWKDTVKAAPGEIVKIIATYDLAGEYVWHCHILEHEDNEMMRPFLVVQ